MALNDVDAAIASFTKALQFEPNDGTISFYMSLFSLFKFYH